MPGFLMGALKSGEPTQTNQKTTGISDIIANSNGGKTE